MKVIEPGLLTTVQDLGRVGFQNDGVGPGGAMDRLAMRVANLLVGNPESAAGLEMTLKGPALAFEDDALIAICGADLSPSIADLELPGWETVYVAKGSVVTFGRRVWGARAYLAIAGGIDVPDVLGSKSTYVRAGIGGLGGRPLARGDRLPLGEASGRARRIMAETSARRGPVPFALTGLRMSAEPEELYGRQPVRFVEGPHFGLLSRRDRRLFTSEGFEVTPRSDRMGYRLGGVRLRSAGVADMASAGVVTGAVQLPPGGDPIVLMAERQTTGGYPIVAVVASADLPLVAQLRPGDPIRFAAISIEQAQLALRRREGELRDIMEGVGQRASG